MNCDLCKQELEAYLGDNLPEEVKLEVKAHLESCGDCAAICQFEILTKRTINEEKQVQSNPFLATRVMAAIDALEQQALSAKRIPVYGRILRPVVVSFSISAAVVIGVLIGNIYRPIPREENIPVEMTYMNDASLESVDFLANN